MKQFQIGHSYATRSLCDYECVFSFVISGRTAKTITTKVHGEIVKRGLKVRGGVESFKPYGTYSMCPVVYADERAEDIARCDNPPYINPAQG